MSQYDGRNNLEKERDELLLHIRKLEQELQEGVLTEQEYIDLRDEHTSRAAHVIRLLNDAPASTVSSSASTPSLMAKVGPPNKKIWIVAIASFVLLTGLVLVTGVGDRLTGDNTTGSIEGDSNALLLKARQLTAKSNGIDAVKTYDKVLALDPNNVEALTYRGWLVRLAGLPNEGLKSIDKAISIRPTYPDAHFFKGFIEMRDRNNPSVAVTEFQAFLANDPPEQMVGLVQNAMQEAQALVDQQSKQ